MPLSTFSIEVTLYGLLGTPGKLRSMNLERRSMARLIFTTFGYAGLMEEVDAGRTIRRGVA